MSDALYTVVYVSEAVSPFSEAELDTLLEVSRAYNQRIGVTGFLAYEDPVSEDRPGTFVQRLEGPKDAVREVFESRILPSTRHRNVEIKMEGPISQRTFGDWTMAFQRRGPDDPEGFDHLVDRLGPPPA